MDMRLFLLKKEGEEIGLKPKIKVVSNLNSFSDNDVNFEEFTSLKALFAELSGALKQNDFIVIAISSPIYNKTKLKLMNALSLKSAPSALVEKRIASLSLDEEATERNVLFPEDAVIFPTDDGVNSGFAVKKGKQSIVVLPLDEERTDAVIKKGLVPYITSGYVTPEPEKEEQPAEDEAPVEEAPKAVVTENEKQVALRTLNLLKESGTVIAVNANANSDMLKQLGAGFDGFDEHFVFTPHIEDRGDYNVTDYTAQMARSAKGLSKADFGASISDIFTTDEVDYICIAVATDKSALVRKLYKEPDETDDQFIAGAAEELFALIGEKTSGNTSVGIEIAQEEAPDKKGLKKSSKIIIAVACVLLVAALAVGTLFFIKYKYPKEEPTTTAPETTTTAPETTTEAPKKIDAMTLSQLIKYELENGIINDTAKSAPETTTETTTAGAIVADDDTTTTTEQAELPVSAPVKITVNGVEMDAKEAIARIVEAEMDSSYSAEAIKAQAVVTYTYLKYRNTNWVIDSVLTVDTYSQEVYDAVNEVFGQYLRFGDEVAFTPFHRMSAGKTASSEFIFGKAYDYLGNVALSSDKQRDNYKVETVIAKEEMENAIKIYDASITLEEDAAEWLEVVAHDSAVSSSTGYVEKLKVGNKEVSGMTFIYEIMKDKELASPCFTISYNAEDETFTVTTYGQGYGVGMSQTAADRFAIGGRKYNKILDTFYPGTILETEAALED